jgi:hypothetical protein
LHLLSPSTSSARPERPDRHRTFDSDPARSAFADEHVVWAPHPLKEDVTEPQSRPGESG